MMGLRQDLKRACKTTDGFVVEVTFPADLWKHVNLAANSTFVGPMTLDNGKVAHRVHYAVTGLSEPDVLGNTIDIEILQAEKI